MQARHTKTETFRAALSGRTDAGCGWLRVQLEQPGVLLLRRLGPRRAEADMPRTTDTTLTRQKAKT
jgi:hypothetical protein